MTLTEFLLARIAEDERDARTLNDHQGDWWLSDAMSDHGVDDAMQRFQGVGGAGNPARVLAECEAKRRIMEAFEAERVRRDIYNKLYDEGQLTTNDDLRNRLASNAHCRGIEIAMQALATIYADHSDFHEEWRA